MYHRCLFKWSRISGGNAYFLCSSAMILHLVMGSYQIVNIWS